MRAPSAPTMTTGSRAVTLNPPSARRIVISPVVIVVERTALASDDAIFSSMPGIARANLSAVAVDRFVFADTEVRTPIDDCTRSIKSDALSFARNVRRRSEEHTSELQSHVNLVC